FLDPARWNEPEAHFALKRALNLLVHGMTVRQEGPGAYYVEVEVYEIRESGSFESAWESNPPARLVTPPTGFEDQGSHRATSALAHDCTQAPLRCQNKRPQPTQLRPPVTPSRAARSEEVDHRA